MIGKTISHFKILEKIGAGGMGEVYLAEDTALDRKVALKFLPPHYSSDSELIVRFKREAKAAASLNHPNIITVHEVAEHEGQSYIAMEYVEGKSLKDLISQKELSVNKVIEVARQICEGLQAAHQADIVHRDIKPANILLEKSGRVKIVDFGLAKLKDVTKLTKESSTMGTLSYMSPEQIQSAEVDHRSDVFSLGVVLYEMIAGQLPFKGEYEAAVSYSIMNEEPEPLARYKAGISDEMQRIVDKTLSKDTNTRYQSAADLLADLKGLSKEPTTAAAVRPGKKLFQSRHLIFAATGLLFALAVYIIFSLNNLKLFDTEKPAVVDTSVGQWQNSIAVLPFKNISPDPEQEYFCDGMTEQIITNLSQLQNLKVIARTSVMKFKNTEKIIPEIAKELRVANILEGSIRKVGNRIRVTAKLIQADEGYHLWAMDYDRELDDIFAVQDDVSEAIAGALLTKITVKETEAIKTKGTKSVEAYEYYLKGSYFHLKKFWRTTRMEDFRKSEKMFKKAIELDPNYAEAYAELANLYNTYTFQIEADKKYFDLQQSLIEKAFRLDPNSARVNLAKSMVHAFLKETKQDYESKKRALELKPNDSRNNRAMGSFLTRHGLHHQAINFFTKTVELDPLDPYHYYCLGITHRFVGNFDQAMIDFQNALEIDTDDRLALNYFARFLIAMKKYNEAEKLMARSAKINPGARSNKLNNAFLYAVKGKKDEALQSLEQGGFEDSRYRKIIIYSLLGLKDAAIKLIDKRPFGSSWNVLGSDYLNMLNNPCFAILRDSEDFKVALQKAKEMYEENLIKYGKVFP